jgi:hypothetical protein
VKAHRLVLLAATGVALVLLTGCAPAGSTAIKVDGTSFTKDDVDLFTDFQCGYLEAAGAAGGQVPALSRQDMRSQSAMFLVSTALDRQIVGDAGVKADEAQVQQTMGQLKQAINKVAKGDDRTRLTDLIADYLRAQLGVQDVVVAQLGGEATLTKLGQEAATQAVQQAIAGARDSYAKKADISVDPVYGLDADGLKVGSNGSLSVAISKFAKAASSGTSDSTWLAALPKNQRCVG